MAKEPKPPKPTPPQSTAAAMAVMRMLEQHFGGQQPAVEFARTFAGITLRIPSPDLVEQYVRDKRINDALNRDPSTECVRRLAQSAGVRMRDVAASFAKSNCGVGVRALRAKVAVRDEHSDLR